MKSSTIGTVRTLDTALPSIEPVPPPTPVTALADLITGRFALGAAVQSTSTPALALLPLGDIPSNPSELLSTYRYEEVIEQLSREHDVVVIDTAPVLPVTDGALSMREARIAVIVIRAGQHPMREGARACRQNGVGPCAIIMDDVRPQLFVVDAGGVKMWISELGGRGTPIGIAHGIQAWTQVAPTRRTCTTTTTRPTKRARPGHS
jgi:hypothetical protein